MDLAAFARLLDMAGPEAAAELTERFRDDLHSTAIALKDAIAEMSWDNLRGATHILIALAGTAGADDLHRRALFICKRLLCLHNYRSCWPFSMPRQMYDGRKQPCKDA